MSGAGQDVRDAAGPSDAELSFPFNPDSPHAAEALAARQPVRVYLVDLTGLPAEKVDALVPTLTKVTRERGMTPVFVVDLADFAALRRHGVVFEALPPLAESAAVAPDLDWRARSAECRALILAKWRPVGQTALGAEEGP